MADVKISDLTAAGTVNDADEVAIVQSGDTKKAAVSLLKAAVAPSLATESATGIIEIANQTEAESGSNDSNAMTSLKVQQWADNGMVLDSATGGNQGDGTINATGLFVNGEAVGSGGGLTLISSSTPTGTSVTFSDIPQTYAGLALMWDGISFDTATRALRINAYANSGASGLLVSGFQVLAATTLSLPSTIIPQINQPAASSNRGYFQIMGYQEVEGALQGDQTLRKFSAKLLGATGEYIVEGCLSVSSVGDAGLDTIIFDINGSGNFDAGTVALYGVS